jgi:hypothetical protein
MRLVIFDVMLPGLSPEHVADGARAARAPWCLVFDAEDVAFPGTVFSEIDEHEICPLASFGIGAQVYIEGLPEESLNVADGPARIWWRGLVIGLMVRGGTS